MPQRNTPPRVAWFTIASILVAATQVSAIDQDRDGLDDSVENQLAFWFAPILYLHSSEDYYPATPAWYMDRTVLRYNHNNCNDHGILSLGQVSNATIGQQSHPDNNIFCTHSGADNPSSGGNETGNFFLQIPNDDNEDITRAGMANPADWTCFANVRPSMAFFRHIDIQFWFFYARSAAAGVGHEGDWERITVRVLADAGAASGYTIQAVLYASHGQGTWYFPGEFALESGRPVVYAACGSHASYPTIGSHEVDVPWLPDLDLDHTNAGLRHDFRTSVSRLGTRGFPANGHLWLDYNGLWGEIGSFVSGPSGPGFKGPYVLEAIANNPPPADHHFAERDGPGCFGGLPPVFVPAGLGTVECPWATLDLGLANTPAGHMLRLREGSYLIGGLIIDQAVTITSFGGSMVTLR